MEGVFSTVIMTIIVKIIMMIMMKLWWFSQLCLLILEPLVGTLSDVTFGCYMGTTKRLIATTSPPLVCNRWCVYRTCTVDVV